MRIALLLLPLAVAACEDIDIHAFSQTTTTLTGGTPLASETDSVTVVAAVGVDNGDNTDLAGATLADDVGNTYAGFQAGSTGGTFTATLTFDDINQVAPLTFPVSGGERTFVATFYDDIEDVATRELTLHFTCRGSDGQLAAACKGVCQGAPSDTATCVP